MTQDMPNTVGETAQHWHDNHVRDRARIKLAQAMRASTDPRWVQQQLAPMAVEHPRPRNWNWLIWPALLVGALFSLWLLKVATANASEPRKQPVFVIWNETMDKQAHAHQFTSPTACNTDIGGVAKTTPDGSRLSCRRIDRKEQ